MSLRCRQCSHVFESHQALGRTEWRDEPALDWNRAPVPVWVSQCPRCSSEALESFYGCLECGTKPAAEGDDLCVACREAEELAEIDYLRDLEHEARQKPMRELSEALIDIAVPFRRTA